jgi:hypothetical protein
MMNRDSRFDDLLGVLWGEEGIMTTVGKPVNAVNIYGQ